MLIRHPWLIPAAAISIFFSLLSCASPPGAAVKNDAAVDGPASQPTNPSDAAKAVMDIRVPLAEGGKEFSHGSGIVISTGEIVTATSVVTDEFGQLLNLRRLESKYLDTGESETALQGGGIILGNAGYDICFIKSTVALGRTGIKVATVDPKNGDPASAASTSADGKSVWNKCKFLGMSRDGRFLAVTGKAGKGDIGGPVIDADGNLIGIIVETGSDIGVPFQAWKDPTGYHWRGVNSSVNFTGNVILCARPFR